MQTALINGRVITPFRVIENAGVLIEDNEV